MRVTHRSFRRGGSAATVMFFAFKPRGANRRMVRDHCGAIIPLGSASLAVGVTRVLREEEVALIQQVASALDPSIRVAQSGREKDIKIAITFNRGTAPSAISSLQTLVLGLCKLYTQDSVSQKTPAASLSPTSANQPSKPKQERNQALVPLSISPLSPDTEDGVETPGQFERPMSLKGQRHVFLYKCRYSQLKAIIDRCGCWGLRMASLEERWPCLVVYCAKSREAWMNAFKKIHKLERNDFLRKRVSDSTKTVDMKRLEELTQTYGQKSSCWRRLTRRNACISLCVQAPSSPKNPSVSVCGITSYVQDLYRVFVEYHLAPEDEVPPKPMPPTGGAVADMTGQNRAVLGSASRVAYGSMISPMYMNQPSNCYYPYSNDIFFPVGNHPLYTPFSSSPYTNQQDIANDIRDQYNTTLNNPHLDKYPYSQLGQSSKMGSKALNYQDSLYSLNESFFNDQYALDNENYFTSDFRFGNQFDLGPTKEGSLSSFSTHSSLLENKMEESYKPSMLSAVSETRQRGDASPPLQTEYAEFAPAEKEKAGFIPAEKEKMEFAPAEKVKEEPHEPVASVTQDLSMENDPSPVGGLSRRDDNFELFMNNGDLFDSFADSTPSGLSFNVRWHDDGW